VQQTMVHEQQALLYEQQGVRLRQETQLLQQRRQVLERSQQDIIHLEDALLRLPTGRHSRQKSFLISRVLRRIRACIWSRFVYLILHGRPLRESKLLRLKSSTAPGAVDHGT